MLTNFDCSILMIIMIIIFTMSLFTNGEFKTREQWLKKQKRAQLKKQQQKFNQNLKLKQSHPHSNIHQKQKLNQILTMDTEKSILLNQTKTHLTFKNEADQLLYHSMEARLKQIEQTNARQRKQLLEISKQIQQTKTENALLRGINSEIPQYSQKEKIGSTNLRLKQQFEQMQTFLNSHGAFYEGASIVGNFNLGKVKQDIKESKHNYQTPTIYQLTTISQRIQELNQNLSKQLGSKKITNASGVAKFIECQTISISFYRNMVSLQGIGKYEYSSKDGKRILQDLLDGYYPHVMKNLFPDGVYFKVQNCLDKQYEQNSGGSWFFGKAHSLQHNS